MARRLSGVALLRWLPALGWMGWIFWLSSQQALPPPPGLSYTLAAIGGHFALYLVLTLLLLVAVGAPRRGYAPALLAALLIAIGYALSDEFHQAFVPGRDAALFDLLVDGVGIAFGLLVWVFGWRSFATH